MARKKKAVKKVEVPKRRWGWIVLIIAISFGFLFIGCVSLLSSVDIKLGNVASIPIKGVILMDGTKTQFGTNIASATEIIAFIDEANENDFVEAIILDINSPGGSAVASMELAEAIRESEKPVVAVIPSRARLLVLVVPRSCVSLGSALVVALIVSRRRERSLRIVASRTREASDFTNEA